MTDLMNMKGGAVIPIAAGDAASGALQPGNDVPLLLTTKLNPPRLGRGILPRSRLEDMAATVAERRLSLLKAPPGFGKTTLATIWADRLASQGHTVAWLSLDEEDESVQRVLFYLAAALNHAAPEIGRACLSLRAELTFFTMETLASLLINENADPDVRSDLEDFLDRLVPKGDSAYRHTAEGPDDMPSHIRMALTQVSLSIPVTGGRLGLGTWQGIYLWEHRDRPSSREILVTVN